MMKFLQGREFIDALIAAKIVEPDTFTLTIRAQADRMVTLEYERFVSAELLGIIPAIAIKEDENA